VIFLFLFYELVRFGPSQDPGQHADRGRFCSPFFPFFESFFFFFSLFCGCLFFFFWGGWVGGWRSPYSALLFPPPSPLGRRRRPFFFFRELREQVPFKHHGDRDVQLIWPYPGASYPFFFPYPTRRCRAVRSPFSFVHAWWIPHLSRPLPGYHNPPVTFPPTPFSARALRPRTFPLRAGRRRRSTLQQAHERQTLSSSLFKLSTLLFFLKPV